MLLLLLVGCRRREQHLVVLVVVVRVVRMVRRVHEARLVHGQVLLLLVLLLL